MKFIEELKRRNVIKATMAYIVISWVLIQVLTIILPVFQAPEWVLKTLMILMVVGLLGVVYSFTTSHVTFDEVEKILAKYSEEEGEELQRKAMSKMGEYCD